MVTTGLSHTKSEDEGVNCKMCGRTNVPQEETEVLWHTKTEWDKLPDGSTVCLTCYGITTSIDMHFAVATKVRTIDERVKNLSDAVLEFNSVTAHLQKCVDRLYDLLVTLPSDTQKKIGDEVRSVMYLMLGEEVKGGD